MTNPDSSIHPESSPESAPSRSARATIALRCEARQGTRSWQWVILEDISEAGFRMSGYSNPSNGVGLSIKIPGLQVLNARICWIEGGVVGCEFTSPLHIAVFEHLVRAARGC